MTEQKVDESYIPVKYYVRPEASTREEFFVYEKDSELEAKVKEIQDCGIEITLEFALSRMVNVCFDTGEFDYEFQLYRSDQAHLKIKELVMSFDKEEFDKAVQAHKKSENDGNEEH